MPWIGCVSAAVVFLVHSYHPASAQNTPPSVTSDHGTKVEGIILSEKGDSLVVKGWMLKPDGARVAGEYVLTIDKGVPLHIVGTKGGQTSSTNIVFKSMAFLHTEAAEMWGTGALNGRVVDAMVDVKAGTIVMSKGSLRQACTEENCSKSNCKRACAWAKECACAK